MKKKKAVARVDDVGNIVIGSSDMIRWGDLVTILGHDVDVAKAVILGKKLKIEIAEQLEKDLKSDTGLLVTFPLRFLMSGLAKGSGLNGDKLLSLIEKQKYV